MKQFQHKVSILIDSEKRLCGRCQYRMPGGWETLPYCDLFNDPIELTKKGHARRLQTCQEAELTK